MKIDAGHGKLNTEVKMTTNEYEKAIEIAKMQIAYALSVYGELSPSEKEGYVLSKALLAMKHDYDVMDSVTDNAAGEINKLQADLKEALVIIKTLCDAGTEDSEIDERTGKHFPWDRVLYYWEDMKRAREFLAKHEGEE